MALAFLDEQQEIDQLAAQAVGVVADQGLDQAGAHCRPRRRKTGPVDLAAQPARIGKLEFGRNLVALLAGQGQHRPTLARQGKVVGLGL